MKSRKYETLHDKKYADLLTKHEIKDSFSYTGIQVQSLSCVLCNAVTFDYKQLLTHIESHLNEKKFIKKSKYHNNQFKCPICEYSASRKASVERHMDSKHNHLKTHQCPICEYTASEKEGLKRHLHSIHNKLKPYECPNCDYWSSHKGDLKKHIDSVHNKLKPHKCP